MERLQKRKLPRLQGYDYSKNGAYFLTLCARDKAHLFGRVVGAGVPDGPTVALSPNGEIVRNRLEEMNRVYYDMRVENYLSHWTYIDGNPALWAEDEYYTA